MIRNTRGLLVRLPERKLSLFILANSNVLSDPFRLLMGDVTKSPFAMSFLRLFAFSPPGTPLSRPARADSAAIADAVAARESRSTYQYRDELVGWALVDLWTDSLANAKQKIDIARDRYRDTGPDPVLHFATMRLQDSTARERAILEGGNLLDAHPNNRWILLAQGNLLQQHGRFSEGTEVFHRILNLTNQEPDFLRRLFRAWSWMALAQMTAQQNPAEARAYLQRIVRSGVTGDILTDTQRMLDSLDQKRAP
jgi:predicted Zn-dependent protease